MTTDELASALASFLGREHLHFYDAIAPIVYAESIDGTKTFRASRYDHGGDDYLNCPLSEDEYSLFVSRLLAAEQTPLHPFETIKYFEGCLPIEEMARRGEETLRYGPMKPVGLPDPRTGRIPHAVVQLRQDNADGSLYNLVGFQTKLKWQDQERVFRLIPGLEQAEFARLGSVHRNTFVDGPRVLLPTLQLRTDLEIFLAGQLSGVEGYVESAAMGILAGINAARQMSGPATGGPASHDRPRGPGRAYQSGRAIGFSAHEYQFRPFPGPAGQDPAPGTGRSLCPKGAGGSSSLDGGRGAGYGCQLLIINN